MRDTDAAGPGTRTVVVRATKRPPLNVTVGAPAVVTPTAKLPFASEVVDTTPSPVIATLAAPASVSASSTRPAVDATGVGTGGGVGGARVLQPLPDQGASGRGSTASP